VTEGQYVSEGSPVLRLENYGNIWIEADIYPSEQKFVKEGQAVKVTISGYENEPQQMKIDFITPAFETGSQLITIRGSIPNPGNKWQPGLQAIIHLPVYGNTSGITVPNDAVIQEEKGAHVWVESEKGKFEPRLVSVGQQNDDRIEIKEGLDEGDEVVVSGAYLLYSEYVLKKGKHPVN
jgi:membrane fusion protein, copper/silver efflux system